MKLSRREALLLGGFAVLGLATWIVRDRRANSDSKAETCDLLSLGMVPRAQWGAQEPDLERSNERGLYDPLINPGGWLQYPQPLRQALQTIVIHHSALPASEGPLAIQQLHMQGRGYADIGYHLLIADDGTLYEGRPLNVRGSHTGGFNNGSVGIVLLGNFEFGPPAELQMARLAQVIDCLTGAYDISHLAGHRDFQPGETQCPGDALAALLPEMARDAGLLFGTGGYRSPGS